ncbi:MAG: iron-containing alcohol dehydrogenase, partial [Promethearchaeota archaeon]
PRIIYGREAIDQLEMIEGTRAFVVTDMDLIKIGLVNIVTDRLKKYGKDFMIFDKVLPDPPIPIVKEGAKACGEYNPDLIIAVGGGSSIDTAKAIWALYEDPNLEIEGLNPFVRIPTGSKAKLIAIPTTSGTGAETTSAVVLTDPDSHLKLELVNNDVIPTIAIVDPVFVDKMPKKLTSSTAFDAMAHCIEGITGRWRNIYSEGLAALSLRLIFANLLPSYHESKPEAREAVHNAATIAGLSFGNAQVQAGHSIGHSLGALFHIPHGLAVGMVLPYLMQFLINNDENVVEILASMAKCIGQAEWSDDMKTAANKLLTAVKTLQKDVDFPQTLAEYGLTKDDVIKKEQEFKDLVLQSGALTICPVNMDGEIAFKIVQYMVDGKDIDF